MKLFSERQGIKKEKAIQLNSMDEGLKVRLWNLLTNIYFSIKSTPTYFSELLRDDSYFHRFTLKLFDTYLKISIDQINSGTTKKAIVEYINEFYFNIEWYKVYDFIEFTANYYPNINMNRKFVIECNSVLEEEKSGYRFVSGKITPITSNEEIREIEEALESTDVFKPASEHIQKALELFSDRESPHYSNSIKESISAVEAVCRIISGDEKATLGKALKRIEKESKVDLHSALNKAFEKLYGWTSDEKGIRHASMDDNDAKSEDAKFMLISCSAFINYMKEKAIKAGIEL